eukprot:scaffold8049_cov286-Pinguiococcus_pyrenoidosus.AAC.5
MQHRPVSAGEVVGVGGRHHHAGFLFLPHEVQGLHHQRVQPFHGVDERAVAVWRTHEGHVASAADLPGSRRLDVGVDGDAAVAEHVDGREVEHELIQQLDAVAPRQVSIRNVHLAVAVEQQLGVVELLDVTGPGRKQLLGRRAPLLIHVDPQRRLADDSKVFAEHKDQSSLQRRLVGLGLLLLGRRPRALAHTHDQRRQVHRFADPLALRDQHDARVVTVRVGEADATKRVWEGAELPRVGRLGVQHWRQQLRPLTADVLRVAKEVNLPRRRVGQPIKAVLWVQTRLAGRRRREVEVLALLHWRRRRRDGLLVAALEVQSLQLLLPVARLQLARDFTLDLRHLVQRRGRDLGEGALAIHPRHLRRVLGKHREADLRNGRRLAEGISEVELRAFAPAARPWDETKRRYLHELRIRAETTSSQHPGVSEGETEEGAHPGFMPPKYTASQSRASERLGTHVRFSP